jgi:predicted small secreted protein
MFRAIFYRGEAKMKKFMALTLAVFSAIFILSGCNAKDGLQGPPGQDGKDGMNGMNGAAALTSCLKCHTDSLFNQKTMEYNLSKHFLGTTSARNSRFCVRCHTNEGFQEVVWDDQPWGRAEIPNSTRIACQTCHKHAGFDFQSDTIANILRTSQPVIVNYLNQATLNGWVTTKTKDFTQPKSRVNNLCINCHQIRGATSYEYTDTAAGKLVTKPFTQLAYFPLGTAILPGDTATEAKGNLKKPTDSVAYMAGRSFSVHDGNQSSLFYGIYGYDFSTPITIAKRYHEKDACSDCHMNEWNAKTKTGGHSMIMNPEEKACVACHNLKDTVPLTQKNITAKINELGEAMVKRKMAKKSINATTGIVSYTLLTTHDFYGKLYSNNPADSAVLYAGLTNANKVDTATAVIKYTNMVTYAKDADLKNRIGRKWTYGELGAAYNFGFINSEFSKGAHNDEYARKLLQASIDWLATHP